MPGQRRTGGGRARGSTLARLAGIGLVVMLAAAGVIAYLVTLQPRGAGSGATLSTRVVSYQTVGLLAEDAQPRSSGQLLELVSKQGKPQFSPVSQDELQSGTGNWTADLMVGGSYIFIFLGSDDCLAVTDSEGQPRLALQHCDLQANQRWRRVGTGTLAQGHNFYAYANAADRSCITEGSELPGQVSAASLSACSKAATNQVLAFWWSAG
jgi:hypothetical protein